MEKHIERHIDSALYLAFYGKLLTERQREILRYYYEEDLSLSEIASLCGMTRQAAHDAIKRGEKQLFAFEEQLGQRKRFKRVTSALGEIKSAVVSGDQARALLLIDELLVAEEEQDGL